jgi:hypothetical protein
MRFELTDPLGSVGTSRGFEAGCCCASRAPENVRVRTKSWSDALFAVMRVLLSIAGLAPHYTFGSGSAPSRILDKRIP